jgi:hypothetical protein
MGRDRAVETLAVDQTPALLDQQAALVYQLARLGKQLILSDG